MLGKGSKSLPDKWKEKIRKILASMKEIFPLQGTVNCVPPFNLLELYVELFILVAEKEDGSIEFNDYYRVFMTVENQLPIAE